MKTIFFCLINILLFTSPKDIQDATTITATYENFKDGIYSFSVEDRERFEFEDIQHPASTKYDLKSGEFIGKKFKVTFIIEIETDEFDEEYDSYIITDLELIE